MRRKRERQLSADGLIGATGTSTGDWSIALVNDPRKLCTDLVDLGVPAELTRKAAGGELPAFDDELWAKTNDLARLAVRRGDLSTTAHIRQVQARLVHLLGTNDDTTRRGVHKLRRDAMRAELRAYAKDGLHAVEVIACPCTSCRHSDRHFWPIPDAYKQMPIPHADCTTGWCRCTWTAHIQMPASPTSA